MEDIPSDNRAKGSVKIYLCWILSGILPLSSCEMDTQHYTIYPTERLNLVPVSMATVGVDPMDHQ